MNHKPSFLLPFLIPFTLNFDILSTFLPMVHLMRRRSLSQSSIPRRPTLGLTDFTVMEGVLPPPARLGSSLLNYFKGY
jgi:hypothetical protein